ncbi:major facilitator superfamily domain-containing protein, partial [Mycena rebaudengoi]
ILGFGFSKSFWSLLFFRCIQGAFNGSIGSFLLQISDPTNVGDIFSFIPIVWCIGTTLSPFMGGMLANPEQNWPDTFGKVAIFRNYPYLLPCVFVASLAFTAFGFVFFGFKETAPPAVGRAKDKRPRSRSPCETDPLLPAENRAAALPETASPTLRELLTRPVIVAIVNFGLLSFLDMCCEALFPLAFATFRRPGRTGTRARIISYQIGTILAFGGFVNAIAQLSLGGRMIRRFGPRRIFIAGFCAFVLEFAIFPLLGFFANRAGRIDAAVIGVLLVQLGCTIFVYFSYTTTVTFITDASQTVNNTSAGSVNGLAQTMAAFMRSAAPSFASSLFALSIGHKIAGGNMVYIILVFVALGAVRLSLLLPRRLASDLAGQ